MPIVRQFSILDRSVHFLEIPNAPSIHPKMSMPSWMKRCDTKISATQSGAIRLLSNSRITLAAPTPAIAAQRLRDLTASTSHIFVADSLDLLDNGLITLDRVTSHSRLTDSYLLALAVQHDATLATMDRKLNASVVAGGVEAYLVIP